MLEAVRPLFNDPLIAKAVGLTILGASIGVFIALIALLLSRAWLEVASGKMKGSEFILDKFVKKNGPSAYLGSSPLKSDIVLPDPDIDPQHALLKGADSHFTLKDLSLSGTWINGKKIELAQLRANQNHQDRQYRAGLSRKEMIMKKNLADPLDPDPGSSGNFDRIQPPGPGEEVLIRITQIDTSDFPQVTVYLAATDAEGEPVGLNPARIQLLENETVIPLDQIQGAGQVDPLSVLLAVDISGSMLYAGKLEAARAAARVFVEGLRPEDQVGLLTFHTEIDYPQPLTADRELIYSAIEALEAVDDTALYDALLEGIGILSEVGGRKAIVLITDGLDTLSHCHP